MTDIDRSSMNLAPASYAPAAAPGSSSASKARTWQDGDTTSFRDILAIVNPLQHIPVVGTVYRALTGDSIATMPSIIGGTLFGGPVGLVLSLASNAFKSETGMDPGETVVASLFGPGSQPAADTPQMAQASAAPQPVVPPPAPRSLPKLVIDIPAPKPETQTAAASIDPLPGPPAGMPLSFHGEKNLLASRFRSTDLPQPVGEGGGVPSRSGADLIPTAGGTAIKRDEVPTAMFSALDKYSAMMRARNAASAQPTQVSLLR